MLDFTTTDRAALRSSETPWSQALSLRFMPQIAQETTCDVVIVGAGITGALLAEHLTDRGKRVVIVDCEKPGLGSTAASTAMLQWEIDAPMTELAERYGQARAASLYQRSFRAVEDMHGLVRRLAIPCGMIPRTTLYLAEGEAGPKELMEELALRRKIGLPGTYLDGCQLEAAFGIRRKGAIASPGSAEADPLRLAQGLLRVAIARGAQGLKGKVVAFEGDARGGCVTLESGQHIVAGAVVLASGYAFPDQLRSDLHSVASSWAIATKPQPPGTLWRDRAMMWDASESYNYIRTTPDNRIIIGGEDEDLEDAEARDALIPAKSETLRARLAELWPGADLDIDYEWAGAFGETRDGLPLIGRLPGEARIFAAYGYGGNGITFSYMASRMIAAMIEGQDEPWFRYVAPDRQAN